MEQKTLHFDRPLLSAKRFRCSEDSARIVRRPPYESEVKSGPVVPYAWEQILGRPKDDESRVESPPGRQLHKMVNGDKGLQLCYGPDYALEYSQCNGDGDEESDADEKSDAGYDEGEKFHGKACGLLQGLGLRRSSFLLKLLPRMSMRSCAPTPPPTTSRSKTSSWCCSKPDYPSFRELLAGENQSNNSSIGSSAAEKTLYVDTEHEVRSLHVKSCASGANGQTEPEVKSQEIITKKGAKSETKFQIPDFRIVSSKGRVDQKTKLALQEPSIQEQDVFEGSKMPEENCTKVHEKVWRNIEESKMYSEFQASLPSIKSPSDSWLAHVLPSISSKTRPVHSHRGTWMTPKEKASKVISPNPTWETMVRMRKMQDKHLCFSEVQAMVKKHTIVLQKHE